MEGKAIEWDLVLYKWQDILKNKTLTHSNGHFTFQNAPHLSLFFFFPLLTSYTCQVYHRKNKNKNIMKLP